MILSSAGLISSLNMLIFFLVSVEVDNIIPPGIRGFYVLNTYIFLDGFILSSGNNCDSNRHKIKLFLLRSNTGLIPICVFLFKSLLYSFLLLH